MMTCWERGLWLTPGTESLLPFSGEKKNGEETTSHQGRDLVWTNTQDHYRQPYPVVKIIPTYLWEQKCSEMLSIILLCSWWGYIVINSSDIENAFNLFNYHHPSSAMHRTLQASVVSSHLPMAALEYSLLLVPRILTLQLASMVKIQNWKCSIMSTKCILLSHHQKLVSQTIQS